MDIAVPVNLKVHRIAVGVFFFIAGLTFATWASRIPDIKNALHLSDAGLGLVLFALPVGQLIGLPVSAWFIARYGSRNLVIISSILYPLTLLLLSIATAPWHLVIGLCLFGFWANLMNIAMNTQAVGVEKIFGKSIMASFHGLWSLAGFTGAVTGSFFISAGISPAVHFFIVCLAAAVLITTSFKYTLPDEVQPARKGAFFTKPDRYILILGLIAFCCMLCEGAMADWSGVYFQKVVKADASLTALGYVAFTSTMATGRFLGDWLVMKWGVQRMLQVSGITIASGLLIAVIFPYLPVAIAGFLLIGFGVSSVVPIVYGLAGRSKLMSASTALATVSTISFLGFLIGPPVIGFIAQLSSLRFSFALIALLGLGTTLLAKKLK